MFDTLTRDQLYTLHTQLHDEGKALHDRIMNLPPLSDEAQILGAKHAEVSETMRAVYDEIDRRKQETTGAPANADGSDHERPMPEEWVHETAYGIEDWRPADA